MSSPWDNVSRQYGLNTDDETEVASEGVSEQTADTPSDEGSGAPRAGLPLFDEIMHSSGTEVAEAQARKKRSTLVTGVVSVLIAALLGGGGYLVYRAYTDSQIEDTLSLPSDTYQDAQVDHGPVDATTEMLNHEWPVVNADSDQGSNTWDINTEDHRIQTMSIARMAPGSVFIPESGIYMEVQGSDKFEPSKYGDLQTIHVPTNVHRGVWYSDGAPLTQSDTGVLTNVTVHSDPVPTSAPTPAPAPSSSSTLSENQGTKDQNTPNFGQGTTFIASHVAWTKKHRGALYTMATDVKKGELIWAKGFDGSLSTWRVNGMWTAEHEAFPADYFSAKGERRLVLTTCGGRVNSQGYYQQNVFLVAAPVPLKQELPH
jgi:hypothetical protein